MQLCCTDMFTFCCFLLFIEFFILHTFNELNKKLKKNCKDKRFIYVASIVLFIFFVLFCNILLLHVPCFVRATLFFVGYCIACLRRSRDNNRQSTKFFDFVANVHWIYQRSISIDTDDTNFYSFCFNNETHLLALRLPSQSPQTVKVKCVLNKIIEFFSVINTSWFFYSLN